MPDLSELESDQQSGHSEAEIPPTSDAEAPSAGSASESDVNQSGLDGQYWQQNAPTRQTCSGRMYCAGVHALLARHCRMGRSGLYARVGSGFAQARAANTQLEPKTYKQAMASPEQEDWKAAIKAELDTLDKHRVWKLVDRKVIKDGRKVLTGKWVFKRKKNADGETSQYKARFVVQGFEQQEGIDYNETYSPVACYTMFRTMLAIIVLKKGKV